MQVLIEKCDGEGVACVENDERKRQLEGDWGDYIVPRTLTVCMENSVLREIRVDCRYPTEAAQQGYRRVGRP